MHNQKFTCSEVTQSFLTLLDIAQSYWKSMEQRNPSHIAKEAMRNKRQNLSKKRTVRKDEFLTGTRLAQMKKLKTNESCVHI